MRILFVRHGESQANILRELSNRGLRHGLTRSGRGQVHALAQKLAGRPITRIYSSPILRAIETSVILAGQLDLEYEVTDALREYDCGILEGHSDEVAWRSWQELFEAWTVHGNWHQRIPGGENLFDIQKRFEPFIKELLERYAGSNEDVLCVSHGMVLTMMMPFVCENLDARLVSMPGIGYASCIIAELFDDGLFCVEWDGQPISHLIKRV